MPEIRADCCRPCGATEKPLAVIRRSPPQYCGKPSRYCGEDPRVAPRWVLLTCSARLLVGLVTVWRVADLTGLLSGRTNWRREVAAPMRSFLRTEAGSSGVLAAAIVLALLWANLFPGMYDDLWRTHLSIGLGDNVLSLDLREWINSGLMTLFFLVVGLEARREFDLGDLRDRTRFILPMLAGIAGMVAPVLIYLAFNAGGPGSHGWGVAMSTDTALALGLLALVGRGVPDRVRVFLLTVFVVDDLIALLVIAVVYSENISLPPLVIAVAAFAAVLIAALLKFRHPSIYVALGIVTWAALLTSGVDPVVAGLAIGL